MALPAAASGAVSESLQEEKDKRQRGCGLGHSHAGPMMARHSYWCLCALFIK